MSFKQGRTRWPALESSRHENNRRSLRVTFVRHLRSCANRSQPAKILGIDHVSFYTTSPDGVKALYSGTLGLAPAEPIEARGMARYMVGKQWVGYSAEPDPASADRLDHVAFTTDNVDALREFSSKNGIKASAIEGRARPQPELHRRRS
jgi:hypothetical protein